MMFLNLLIVEDEEAIREGVREFLSEQGFTVFEACDGVEALEVFNRESVDLILLDIMMPRKNGFEVLEEVRQKSNVPILMLTALQDEETQVKSFELLVDGYIQKPFSLMVLYKRIEALLKRHYGEVETWSYQDTSVNFTRFEAYVNNQLVEVTAKELSILKLLVKHEGQALSRSQILDHVWSNHEDPPFDRVVDVYIKQLRKKLKLDCIVTIKNGGYKLELK